MLSYYSRQWIDFIRFHHIVAPCHGTYRHSQKDKGATKQVKYPTLSLLSTSSET